MKDPSPPPSLSPPTTTSTTISNSTTQNVKEGEGEANQQSIHQQEQQQQEESFDDLISELLIGTEELKRFIHPSSENDVRVDWMIMELNEIVQQCHFIHQRLSSSFSSKDNSNDSNHSNNTQNNQNKDQTSLKLQAEIWDNLCYPKTKQIAQIVWERLIMPSPLPPSSSPTNHVNNNSNSSSNNDVPDQDQPGVAHVLQLILSLYNIQTFNQPSSTTTTTQTATAIASIIQQYANYQRQVFRQRSKPCIAQLAAHRKKQQQQFYAPTQTSSDNSNPSSSQHSIALTTVLTQASSLIHPLLQWYASLVKQQQQQQQQQKTILQIQETCVASIQLLNQQTQSMIQSISQWFFTDFKVDSHWIPLANDQNNNNNNSDSNTTSTNATATTNLDQILNEMAFTCQLLSRYIHLFYNTLPPSPASDENNNQNTALATSTTIRQANHTLEPQSLLNDWQHSFLPEWTWKYTLLERLWMKRQFTHALHHMAQYPLEIMVGRPHILVPSHVEDAQYISTHAIQRAISTHSHINNNNNAQDALGIVAHALQDVWSTDQQQHNTPPVSASSFTAFNNNNKNNNAKNNLTFVGGVHYALLHQIGCQPPPTVAKNNNNNNNKVTKQTRTPTTSPPSTGNNTGPSRRRRRGFFASAWNALDPTAISDDDDDDDDNKGVVSSFLIKSPPTSGGLFGGGNAKEAQFQQLQTQLCAMNGMYSASAACLYLVETLENAIHDDDTDDENESNEQDDLEDWQQVEMPNQSPSNTTTTSKTTINHSSRMIDLAMEELRRYAHDYKSLLRLKIQSSITEWCGSLQSEFSHADLFVFHALLEYFGETESYQIHVSSDLERRLEEPSEKTILAKTLRACPLLRHVTEWTRLAVRFQILVQISIQISNMIVECLWRRRQGQFTEMGALLFSKQVRFLQEYITSLLYLSKQQATTTEQQQEEEEAEDDGQDYSVLTLMKSWNRLSQVVTILQLERPADWMHYATTTTTTQQQQQEKSNNNNNDDNDDDDGISPLTLNQIRQTMSLRMDFRPDAIQAICQTLQEKK